MLARSLLWSNPWAYGQAEKPHWLAEKSEKSPSEGERKNSSADPIHQFLIMDFSWSVPLELSLKWNLTALIGHTGGKIKRVVFY